MFDSSQTGFAAWVYLPSDVRWLVPGQSFHASNTVAWKHLWDICKVLSHLWSSELSQKVGSMVLKTIKKRVWTALSQKRTVKTVWSPESYSDLFWSKWPQTREMEESPVSSSKWTRLDAKRMLSTYPLIEMREMGHTIGKNWDGLRMWRSQSRNSVGFSGPNTLSWVLRVVRCLYFHQIYRDNRELT